ncbi:hypothetical protein Lal_00038598 [Lupinus albus]|nr:hypothetical protein Lal_00038598 [Lupinus albus]
MQFEYKESMLDAIKKFHICNSFDYVVVESKPNKYVGRCKHYGAGCEWCIRESLNILIYQLRPLSKKFQIYGDWEGSYNDLPRWMNDVHNFALGTIVCYEVSRHFVVALKPYKVSWAFKPALKGLHIANQFYKLMLCLLLLKEKRRKHEIDKGTGLLNALRTQLQEWSNVESVYCIRHLASNFNKEFRDYDLKDKVIEMSYELIRPRFEWMLSALREKNPRAGAWLDHIPKAKWAQCYDEGRQYGHITTNLAECVNNILKGSRALSITALVQTTYYRLNSWFVDHRDKAVNMIKAGHIYCEDLTNVIKENQRQSTYQLVRSFSRETGVAEVEAPSRSGGRHSKFYTVYELEFQQIGNEEYWPSYFGPSFIPNPIMRRK